MIELLDAFFVLLLSFDWYVLCEGGILTCLGRVKLDETEEIRPKGGSMIRINPTRECHERINKRKMIPGFAC